MNWPVTMLIYLGGWEWSDNSAFDFTNWAANEPNDVGDSGEQCAEFYTDGKWNDNVLRTVYMRILFINSNSSRKYFPPGKMRQQS